MSPNESDSNKINITITMNILPYLKILKRSNTRKSLDCSVLSQSRSTQKIWYKIKPEVKTYQLRCEWYIFLHFTDSSSVYSTESRKWVDPGWLRTLLESLQNLKIQLKYLNLTRLDSFFRLFQINFIISIFILLY